LPATAPAPIRVYISGEVIYPDVYELPSDAIMQDVVNAAGGFSPLADPNIVNLAMALSDGLHVHIPKPGSEPIIEIENNGTADSSSFSAPININTASLKQLDLLPGIGPVTAQKILDFRQANGPFSDIADIQQVSGIGPAKYDQMRELIVVR
jgi:competence protein ComEA